MRPFDLVRAADEDAASRLAAGPDAAFVAGGTDLLPLMKDGVRAPRRLVDITALVGLAEVRAAPEGVRIGALARMSDVAEHDAVRRGFPAVSQALLAGASPQIRNAATIGGNLLQRTRCAYFRDTGFPACNKRAPGSGCAAQSGENRAHAILGASPHCIATYPGDLAVALVALDAVVRLRGGRAGERAVPLGAFHRPPGDTPHVETVLEPRELIVAVEVPAAAHARRSGYLKVRDRASFEFAVVSAAVGLDVAADGAIRSARAAAGGVATTPWRLPAVEAALVGRRATPATFAAAAALAVEGAAPRESNAFKIELLPRVVARALAIVGGHA